MAATPVAVSLMQEEVQFAGDHITWERAEAQEGDGVLRFDWDDEMWLGIMIFNPNENSGLIVTSVEPGGLAARYGVKLGDKLTEINGRLVPEDYSDQQVAELLFNIPRPVALGFRPRQRPMSSATSSPMRQKPDVPDIPEVPPDLPLNAGVPIRRKSV
uniref:PDZ domain-containing protein n=1 Tax=Rhizochromulina marina TaxID=1034831 RepID=A0A7S2REB8_9STRA|mmetsp:Transcript_15050/g.44580  ORF Transcript_15050/g.44580 Transcript_15050/m.44580 type:complete len:158 (+) Transcript_15050:55-528(+)